MPEDQGYDAPTPQPTSTDADQLLARLEKKPGTQTARGLREHAHMLGFENEAAFIQELQGKKVADVGSGYGGLEIDIIARGLPLDVTPISPRAQDKLFLTGQRNAIMRQLGRLYTSETLDAAIKTYNEQVVHAYAHDLPFPDESFDIMLDILAATHYTPKPGDISGASEAESRAIYQKTFAGMIRPLKRGGKLYIKADCFIPGLSKGREAEGNNPWELQIMRVSGHRVDEIHRPSDGFFTGVVVTK